MPLHPEEGYVVTEEDFPTEARRRKVQRMEGIEGAPMIDYRKASLELCGEIEAEEVERRGFLARDR